jgi:hypothetical protein
MGTKIDADNPPRPSYFLDVDIIGSPDAAPAQVDDLSVHELATQEDRPRVACAPPPRPSAVELGYRKQRLKAVDADPHRFVVPIHVDGDDPRLGTVIDLNLDIADSAQRVPAMVVHEATQQLTDKRHSESCMAFSSSCRAGCERRSGQWPPARGHPAQRFMERLPQTRKRSRIVASPR